ncbi:MAG: Exosome complex component Rrp4 [archaeon ADurb.Bin336]|nr:MAG: Exosome complex component Rrp4 [archaeon ADurb.Bin336]
MSKKVVIPGELISAERKRLGSNVFVSNGKIYSKVLGISEEGGEKASVVPLEGRYPPQQDDVVIGVVTRAIFAGYNININSFVESFIPKSAIRDDLKVGDLVSAKVEYVNELREADLGFARRLYGGEVIEVTPVRTPRLIGKGGSMLELLKQGTGCDIIIGKNGRVWARNGNTELLKKVVLFINDNSFKSNLTNSVEEFFKAEGIPVSAPKRDADRVNNFVEESEVIVNDLEESELLN